MNLENFLINIKIYLYSIKQIRSSDKRVLSIISDIKNGKSLYEAVQPYDSLKIVVNNSVDSIELLGIFLNMQKQFKEQLIFSMLYPIFMNLLMIAMFLFISKFFNLSISFIFFAISIVINLMLSGYIVHQLNVRMKYIEKLCLWIYILKGKVSAKVLNTLNINILNYTDIFAASYDLFQCNSLLELENQYQYQYNNVSNYFKMSVQIISACSIFTIGVNLCIMIFNISRQNVFM